MIVEGTCTFAASAERVYGLLLDPAVMEKSMPGAEGLRHIENGRYEGKVRVGLGPITAAEFALVVQLKDVRSPTHYGMRIDSTGRLGFTRGEATVDLAQAPGGTTMTYRADLNVGGPMTGVGLGLLDSLSHMMTRQGLDTLSAEIERRLHEPPPPPPPPTPPRPPVPPESPGT